MVCEKHLNLSTTPAMALLDIAMGMFANGESLEWPESQTERRLRAEGKVQQVTIEEWNQLSREARTALVVVRLRGAGFPNPSDLANNDLLLKCFIEDSIPELAEVLHERSGFWDIK
jgi:hypothetical protein